MNQIVYAGKHNFMKSVSEHIHSAPELIYCTSGSCTLRYGTTEVVYGADTIVMIPARFPHSHESTEGFANYHVNLDSCSINIEEPVVITDRENTEILSAFTGAFYFYSTDPTGNAGLLTAYGNLIASYAESRLNKNDQNTVSRQIARSVVENYTDSGYALGDMLRTFPFSYDYIIKLFKKDYGVTPHQYLTEMRLNAAANWLMSVSPSSLSVSEVSYICGFSDPLYFSRLFRRRFGMSPTAYARTKPAEKPQDTDSSRIDVE